ncbi:MAG TPA: TlpA disulfide reductase family protein [Pyrinomonadaceae bacterium]|nr:TlpA disulfide reductase family protein [Pyrinomonadaceae bacterium]
MKHFFLVATAIFALGLSASAQTLRIGQPAPQFTGIDITGNDYDLSQMKGKVVVVTFWSTHCLICKTELPKVNQMIRGYEGKDDVVFLAVTTEGDDKVVPYLQKNPQAAHVIPQGFGILLAYADKDAAGNLNFGYPAFYIIDKQGRLAYKGNGWDRVDAVSSTINNVRGQ